MKRFLIIIIMMCLASTLAACGAESGSRAMVNTQMNVTDVLNGAAQGDIAEISVPSEITAKVKKDAGLGTIDTDLTVLSGTVVYSEVYNMVTQHMRFR